MHILIFCKRQYTARDLLDDRYGRLYEIPEALARAGHKVSGLITSYRYRPESKHVSDAGVKWQSVNLGLSAPWKWYRQLKHLKENQPDVIWASSDAPHCIAAIKLGKLLDIPVVLDLYDNYDHFGLTALPFIRHNYHRACRKANAITTVSETLADYVRTEIAQNTPVEVIGNGVNANVFKPLDTKQCRKQLNLPLEARIIGTAGAINASRNINDLFDAFIHMAGKDTDLYLAIAGPQDETPARYAHPRIINMGILDWQLVPVLINALDVAVVCNKDDTFGRYCFPLKLQEAIACGVPVCAAMVGDVPLLLKNQPAMQYTPGNSFQLAEKLSALLVRDTKPLPNYVLEWTELADQLNEVLRRVTQ